MASMHVAFSVNSSLDAWNVTSIIVIANLDGFSHFQLSKVKLDQHLVSLKMELMNTKCVAKLG